MNILSIDGGGIKGIIPSALLNAIETKSGKRIAEVFDLIIGTSTGGIIACGLTLPGSNGVPRYKSYDLQQFYIEKGRDIFTESTIRKIKTVKYLFGPKYDDANIESVLKELLGDVKISETLKPIVVPSYDLSSATPVFFKTSSAISDSTLDFYLYEISRATSSAPSYFKPHLMTIKNKAASLIDGGIFANNPAMCGYAEGLRFIDSIEEKINIISVGCGDLDDTYSYNQVKDWGLVNWVLPILNITNDGVGDTVDYQLKQVLANPNSQLKNYYRLQASLRGASTSADDVTKENIENLVQIATNYINTEQKLLDEIVSLLM